MRATSEAWTEEVGKIESSLSLCGESGLLGELFDAGVLGAADAVLHPGVGAVAGLQEGELAAGVLVAISW